MYPIISLSLWLESYLVGHLPYLVWFRTQWSLVLLRIIKTMGPTHKDGSVLSWKRRAQTEGP